jgi:hypothetical protein
MHKDNYLKIELKYCERCGGLWYRYQGSTQPYCQACLPEMIQVARGSKKQPVGLNWAHLRGGAACA